MKETEKIFKKMEEYLKQFNFENDEQKEIKIQEFIQKLNNDDLEINYDNPKFKSDDLLEEAYYAASKTRAIRLAKQALEIYPDNIDAECFIANFEENQIKKLKKYEAIVEKATEILKRDDMFNEENIGHFWGMIETRPYMRARNYKIIILIDLGRYSEAVEECEDMLKLCENDNLGIRYILIGLYCVLERFDECKKLYNKFKECSAFMLFPMAIMYFKMGDYKKAKKFIKETKEANEYIFKILTNETKMINNAEEIEYYTPGSIEEASIIINDLLYLLGSVPSFITFIEIEANNN